jgi:glycosyltransferase involved in cell wall biosynthesis
MLRVAMIGHKRIPSREGGVEIVVEELAVRMVQQGCTVHVYNRKGHHIAGKQFNTSKVNKEIKEYRGIRIITIPTFQNNTLNAVVYSFLATIRALFGKYDVIHYHAEGPCAMLWIARLFGKRTVATIHGLDWKRSKWGGFAAKYLKFGEKVAAKYAHQIIVLSRDNQRYFKEVYKRETVFIPNGVREPEKTENSNELAKYGIKANEYILFLARIVPEKGLHYLIQAYNDIKPDKRLVIAGPGSHTDDYVDKIKQSVDGNEQIVMTGFVEGEVLKQLFSNAYIYVLPSDVEGMSLSLLEAMSYSNCCLVSDIPENTEVVGESALTFKSGDVDDLTDKLKWIIDNPDVVEKYKGIAAQHVLCRYRLDDTTMQTLGLYNSLIKNS